jgi:hypothetical protein
MHGSRKICEPMYTIGSQCDPWYCVSYVCHEAGKSKAIPRSLKCAIGSAPAAAVKKKAVATTMVARKRIQQSSRIGASGVWREKGPRSRTPLAVRLTQMALVAAHAHALQGIAVVTRLILAAVDVPGHGDDA